FVWRTTTRLQNERLNRHEAERAKPQPWWKRLTPVQSFSYAAIAALFLVGMSFRTIPTPLGNRITVWGLMFGHGNQALTAPQSSALVPGPSGEAAVVTITPTSSLPSAHVVMTSEVPLVQPQTLRGNRQTLGGVQTLEASRPVPVLVQRGGSTAVNIR